MLLSLLPAGLLVLVFSSLALAEPVTPYNPLYDIAKLARRLPDPPICCLRPLPSSEPLEEEILSFEDWKAKQAQAQLHDEDEAGPGSSVHNANHSEDQQQQLHEHQQAPDSQAAEAPASGTEPAPVLPSAHFRIPLTDRFNYANLDCSARIRSAHRSAKHASSILSSKKDRYMLSPCSTPGEQQHVVVELCEDIRIDTVQLANFEFFSGVFREFSVSVAKTDTSDPEGWTQAGTYTAKNVRGVQSFHPPTSLRDFYRYIRIDFHSHYGNEYYCPVSLLRVYGLTHLDAWKWDIWEEESQKKRGEIEESVHVHVPVSPVDTVQDSVPPTEKEDVNLESSGKEDKTTETTVESASVSVPLDSKSPAPAPTSASNESSDVNENLQSTPAVSASSSTVASTSQEAPSQSPSSSSSPIVIDTSSSSTPPIITDSPASESPSSSPPATSSSPSTTSKSVISSSSLPTIIPGHDTRLPAVLSTGESIYRTIMTRLSLLESNSSLYLQYVESQTRFLRSALHRIEEDVGRLTSLHKSQSTQLQKVTEEWAMQRRRLEREHGELSREVRDLREEVVLEKRLGVVQLCVMLVVLVFMALTRGSRGDVPPFVLPPGRTATTSRREALREWGRRQLSSFGSSEWTRLGAAGPRSRPLTPTPKKSSMKNLGMKPVIVVGEDDDEDKEERVPFPVDERTPHTQRRTPVHSMSVPSSSKLRLPQHLIRTPGARHFVAAHRPGTPTPTSMSTSSTHSPRPRSPNLVSSFVVSPNPGLAGPSASANRPRLRRASSHTSPGAATGLGLGLVGQSFSFPAGGLSPLSAKKRAGAKSAHLHEINVSLLRPRSGHGRAKGTTVATTMTATSTPRPGTPGPGGLQPLGEMSPTSRDSTKDAGADDTRLEEVSTVAQEGPGPGSNAGVDVFRPSESTPSRSSTATRGTETEKEKVQREGAAREPLMSLQNRTRTRAREHDASSNGVHAVGGESENKSAELAGPAHRHWLSSLPSPNKIQDVDTESESWVDTDVEGSDAGEGFWS